MSNSTVAPELTAKAGIAAIIVTIKPTTIKFIFMEISPIAFALFAVTGGVPTDSSPSLFGWYKGDFLRLVRGAAYLRLLRCHTAIGGGGCVYGLDDRPAAHGLTTAGCHFSLLTQEAQFRAQTLHFIAQLK